MIVLTKRGYIFMLVLLTIAVGLAAWKNVSAEDPAAEPAAFSHTEEMEVRTEEEPKHSSKTSVVGIWIPYMSLVSEGTEEGFKRNFDEKLEIAAKTGANAVFVHVRPFADSFYPSEYEVWSHVLTGTQGEYPGYDPLLYMIERTHAMGMTFHAWVNPLRISTGSTPQVMSERSFYMQHKEASPEYFMEYDGAVYYNPASAVIRERIADGVAEIARNYNVDGIHFDDYFYPCESEELDAMSYRAYTENTERPQSLQAWRTTNINALISSVYRKVKAADSDVQFGISPQGNIENDLAMGADVYTWCAQNGYIDYICPQLYYSFENEALPFEAALNRWINLPRANGVDLYIGLAVYKAGTDADNGTWLNSTETLAKQIEAAKAGGASGVVLYAVDHIESDMAKAEMANAQIALEEFWFDKT